MKDNYEFKIGEELTFIIYGFTVLGKFTKMMDDRVEIETTVDNICEVGEIQTIHKSHLSKQFLENRNNALNQ